MPRPSLRRPPSGPATWQSCWFRCGSSRCRWSRSLSPSSSGGSILVRANGFGGLDLLHDRRILLIISGGIAAYKSLDLIRRLREQGAAVRCIMTAAAQHFVTPLSVASLSEDKVYDDLWSLTDESEMGHIRLSREANLATLEARSVKRVGPGSGELACGEVGSGRMAEPIEIIAAIERVLAGDTRLVGRRALVTSGPTREPIDPVRYISNHSSGKQGHAIAAALAAFGADTVLVSGPTQEPAPAGVRVVPVETAVEMLAACEAALPVDVAVMAAAVADWRVETVGRRKLKKDGGAPPVLRLAENRDIL